MGVVSWTTLSPLAAYLDQAAGTTLARRPATLKGKVVALLPNWRPSAVQLLKAVGDVLEQRCQLKALILEPQLTEAPNGARFMDAMQGKIDDLAQRVDAVVTGSGD